MKKNLLLTALIVACTASAQTTAIPDPVFEQVLVDLNIDTDGLVNGQMATADAEAVTSLAITSPDITAESGTIHNVTGLEAFVNLESLSITVTMAENLNLSTLVGLKHLNCTDNMLENIDVSNNVLLETLNISSGGDVYPFNWITVVDLSNNPLISEVIAYGNMERIDLRNGNNNAGMVINISAIWADYPPDVIVGNTCIDVDDAVAAQNNAYPYSEWVVGHSNMTYNYVTECTMSTHTFGSKTVTVYPNPVENILNINGLEQAVNTVQIIDLSGRVVQQYANVAGSIPVSGIASGTYLVKVVSGTAVYTQKIIIKS